jgi:hypothetical protein
LIELRKPKGKNGGIGGGGSKNKPKWKRSKLKVVSKKQRKRLLSLKEKREIVLNAQHERWGTTFCMASIAKIHPQVGCSGRLDLAHVKPAGRYAKDRDHMTNLGILCRAHHRHFTVTPGLYDVEYRTPEMQKFMAELE